jgi:hypothetical protein
VPIADHNPLEKLPTGFEMDDFGTLDLPEVFCTPELVAYRPLDDLYLL